MPKFQITTCPACKQEFEYEIDPLPCILITGDEEKEICPLCNFPIDENAPGYKFRFRKELNPVKPKSGLKRIMEIIKGMLS